jgi:hypothetical protein
VSRPLRWRFALALGGAWLGGCGPVEYLSQMDRRTLAALAEAEHHDAATLAPYEYTAAQEYVRQARIEASRASYQRAVDYGRRAEELAAKAEGIARAQALRSAEAPNAEPAPAKP